MNLRIDFAAVRSQFPALKEKVFLDAACVSLAPRVAAEAIQEFLGVAMGCPARSSTLHHLAMDDSRPQARAQAARLVNAREEEIALVESTTHGLSIAANALPLSPGDRVVLSDLEFLQVAIPWCQLRERAGIELKVVPHRDGRLLIDDFAARMTPHTRLVVVSSALARRQRTDVK